MRSSFYKKSFPMLVLSIYLYVSIQPSVAAQEQDSKNYSNQSEQATTTFIADSTKLANFIASYQSTQNSLSINQEEVEDTLIDFILLANKLGDNDSYLYLMNELVNIKKIFGEFEEGKALALSQLNLSNHYQIDEFVYQAYLQLNFFAKRSNNNKELFYYSKQLLKEAKKIANTDYIVYSNDRISTYYRRESQYDSALSYLFFNVELLENQGNDSLLSYIHRRIGKIYTNINDYDTALEYRLKSFELATKTGSKYYIAGSQHRLGDSYMHVGNYKQALPLFKSALEYYRKHDRNDRIAQVLVSIAQLYKRIGNNEKAEAYFLEAIPLFISMRHDEYLASMYTSLAQLYITTDDSKSAELYFNRAISLYTEDKWLSLQRETFTGLIQILVQKKEFEDAYIYQKKVYLIEKKLQTYELDRQIGYTEATAKSSKLLDLQRTTFDNELALKEQKFVYTNILLILGVVVIVVCSLLLLLLNGLRKKELKNLSIIREKNSELRELNAIKANYFTILAHDLLTPSGTILRLSELVHSYSNKHQLRELTPLSGLLEKSAYKFTHLLDSALEWGKLQMDGANIVREPLSLAGELEEVLYHLEPTASHKQVSVENGVLGPIRVLADKNLLNRILYNLISNAIKYSNPKGRIVLSAVTVSDHVALTVKDTGIGIPKKKITQLFDSQGLIKTKGTEGETGIGFGLINSKKMIELNGGTIEITSEIGKGTTVKVILKEGEQLKKEVDQHPVTQLEEA